MKLLVIFMLYAFVTISNSASCKQRCNDEFGVGGVLKHFYDGSMCQCSFPPMTKAGNTDLNSESACNNFCKQVNRYNCYYAPGLGCITYKLIETSESRY
ncbi:hypothetical protein IIV30_177R [Invertebrate iridescent virus 30]|uniref:Uncharacterized protein n=1 Tax=Invertebrate iridescent virus 30 TaxID=345585 RepID=W8W1V1_9VIRU|nr:hypothetical protein IIV30_177R [Invertebrate iridescent virus 30]CCV02372.1 hypothetical protein IIV30_177R [Invertebrate iridescent virus 30]